MTRINFLLLFSLYGLAFDSWSTFSEEERKGVEIVIQQINPIISIFEKRGLSSDYRAFIVMLILPISSALVTGYGAKKMYLNYGSDQLNWSNVTETGYEIPDTCSLDELENESNGNILGVILGMLGGGVILIAIMIVIAKF